MAAEESRQAKALEGLDRSVRELVRVMAAMNENFVKIGNIVKEAIEKADAYDEASVQEIDPGKIKSFDCGCTMLHCDHHLNERTNENPNQLRITLDDIRAQAEKDQHDREQRADFEESGRGEGSE